MPYDSTDFTPTVPAPAKVDPLTITTPRERLEYLTGFLRVLPPERFDMGEPVLDEECGSAACIGGWLHFLFRRDPSEDIRDAGVELLGLTRRQAEDLMFPDSGALRMADDSSPYGAGPLDAADVLDHLTRTGNVNWAVARSASKASVAAGQLREEHP